MSGDLLAGVFCGAVGCATGQWLLVRALARGDLSAWRRVVVAARRRGSLIDYEVRERRAP